MGRGDLGRQHPLTVRIADDFQRIKGARGCCPRVSIPVSRIEKRAILLVCLALKRQGQKPEPNEASVCRDIILRDPAIRKAIEETQKSLDRGRVAHSA